MPTTVYNLCDSVTVPVPSDDWILNGQTDESPFLSGYNNWILTEILADLAVAIAHFPLGSGTMYVDQINTYTNSPDDAGIYFTGSAGSIGLRFWSPDAGVVIQTGDGSPYTNVWTWNNDGTVDIEYTTAINGIRAGADGTSGLYYAYDAEKDVDIDVSPLLGGWSGEYSDVVVSHDVTTLGYTRLERSGTTEAPIRCPLNLPHLNGVSDVWVLADITVSGRISAASGAGITRFRAGVYRRARGATRGSPGTLAELTINATTNTTANASTLASLADRTLDFDTYAYYVRVSAEATSMTGYAEIAEVVLNLTKAAVE